MKGKHSTHLVNVSKAPTGSTSDPDYYNEHGDPVYVHMVNVQDNKCKHLIQFPISTELKKVRNLVEASTKCPTVLLKADMGADVNLMNSKRFNSISKDRSMLQPSSLRMEEYANGSAVEVLGKFHVFSGGKEGYTDNYSTSQIYANNSPNLLSRDGCYTLGVIKPCYSGESARNSSKFQAVPEVIPTEPTDALDKAKFQGDSLTHCENEGTEVVKRKDSSKISIKRDELQGAPLMKARILDVYSDVFTGIGKFPGKPYKFPLKPNSSPLDMHQGKFQFIYRMLSTRKSGIWNNLEFLNL